MITKTTLVLKSVEYLHVKQIEKMAKGLLSDYENSNAVSITQPPIPIDDIAEFHLGLDIDWVPNLLNDFQVLACIDPNSGLIRLNEDRKIELLNKHGGFYNFTVAHEVGHYKMHFVEQLDQKKSADKVLLCRGDDSETPEERKREAQANIFAASLLMPINLLTKSMIRFGGRIPNYTDVVELADEYQVSHSAMHRRLVEKKYIYIDKHGKIHRNEQEAQGQKPLSGDFFS